MLQGSRSYRVAAHLWILHTFLLIAPLNSWVVRSSLGRQFPFGRTVAYRKTKLLKAGSDSSIDLNDLLEMDVVVFSEMNNTSKRQLGAVQENSRITPMCVWTTEPAFGESVEFLVDENDMLPGFTLDQIVIHAIVPQTALSYGSRQVAGGMGPSNPHGELSELLYYIDQSILQDIDIMVKPELEVFW
jgi:hypothetical protein